LSFLRGLIPEKQKFKFTIAGQSIRNGVLIKSEEKIIDDWCIAMRESFIFSDPSWIETATWRGENMEYLREKIFNNDLNDNTILKKKIKNGISRKFVRKSVVSRLIFSPLPVVYPQSIFSFYYFKFVFKFRSLLVRI